MTTKAPISWNAGEELPSITLPPVTRLDLIKYAGASGDYNPIHTIDEEAARAGLPGVIAHGMLTMAVMGRRFPFEHGFIGISDPFYRHGVCRRRPDGRERCRRGIADRGSYPSTCSPESEGGDGGFREFRFRDEKPRRWRCGSISPKVF